MLSRTDKKQQIQQLKEAFSKSKASFVVNCIGLNVGQMTQLRKKLKQRQASLQVIKNTLSLIAMEDQTEIKKNYSGFMEGPNAFVMAFDDPVQVAKVIQDLSEDNEIFKIKGGFLDGKALNSAEIKTLAQLPSKNILQTQFLSLLLSPSRQFLRTLKEVPESLVRLLSAKQSKKEKNEKSLK